MYNSFIQELQENRPPTSNTQIFRDMTNLPERDRIGKENRDPQAADFCPPNTDCTESTKVMHQEIAELLQPMEEDHRRSEQCVEELQAEIFDFCMRTEVGKWLSKVKNLCKSNYFQGLQTDINEKMRAILVDWLVDVHSKFKMTHQTLFLTVNIIDRYLEQIAVPRTQLQLVGVSALFIASKYEEIYPPDLKEFVKCCDNTYTADQILDVESNIILVLNFNLVFTSCYQFFELFSQKSKLFLILVNFEGEGFSLGLYLLYLSTLEFLMAKYRPSIIAMASIYLSNKFLRLGMWHPDLPAVIGSSEKEIKDCALDLFLLVQKAKKSTLTAILRKFAVQKYHNISQIQIKV